MNLYIIKHKNKGSIIFKFNVGNLVLMNSGSKFCSEGIHI